MICDAGHPAGSRGDSSGSDHRRKYAVKSEQKQKPQQRGNDAPCQTCDQISDTICHQHNGRNAWTLVWRTAVRHALVYQPQKCPQPGRVVRAVNASSIRRPTDARVEPGCRSTSRDNVVPAGVPATEPGRCGLWRQTVRICHAKRSRVPLLMGAFTGGTR